MRRSLSVILVLIPLWACAARSEGINLSWTDCASSPRSASSMEFNCDDDARTFYLVGSFIPPGGITQLCGEEMDLNVVSDRPALPDWWRLEEGGCRTNTLAFAVFQTGFSACQNYWGPPSAGGFAYASDEPNAGLGHLRLIAARPSTSLSAASSGREYYSFIITLSSEGTSRCQGCREGVCVVLNSILLTQPIDVGDHLLTNVASRNTVCWQGGAGTCASACERTKRRTWGEIKGMYRQ